jgi:ATP-binding cassette, subfamily C, bacterial CydD
MADGHRIATMRTLRIAFLSALVLELVATLSVALVAVPVGLRLLAGGLTLQTALLVLLLAPEAYLPLRAAGARFHASMEGLTALDDAFALSPTMTTSPPDASGVSAATASMAGPVRLEGVTVAYERTIALRNVSLDIRPGERIAVIGPSGAGKSTLLGLLLGFASPSEGRVLVDDAELSTMDIEAWRRGIAWVPQRPHLFSATLAENIALGSPDAGGDAIAAAVRAAGLDEVVAGLPDGLQTMLGERGHGLSSGQRQRVALARAFLRDAPLVLLDEPTARLDAASEAAILAATRRLLDGRTAVLVAHRPALLAGADRVIRIDDGRVTELARPGAEVVA